MEKIKKYLAAADKIIIIVLIGLLVLQRECTRCPDCPEATHSRTEVWFYDTTRYITQVPVPVPVEVIRPVEVQAVVDTALILRDYFSKYVYDRVLKDDSLAYIRLTDTVSRNRLSPATLQYTDRTPTQIIYNTTTVSNPVNKLFAGPVIGGSFDGNLSLGGSAMLVTKKDHAYSITADPFNRHIQGTAYWKISLHKKRRLR